MTVTADRTLSSSRLSLVGRPVTTQSIVWLRGDHDVQTRSMLTQMLIDLGQADGTDIVLDLSELEFMDAAVVGAIVEARNGLQRNAHELTIRAPSSTARSLLEWCGLLDLVEPTRS